MAPSVPDVSPVFESLKGLGFGWPGGGEDEEEGGTALQLKHWDGQVAQSLCAICRARSQPLLRAASVVRPF